MISGFVVKKGLMTGMFTEKGEKIPVTSCQALPLTVTQIKSLDKDKYQAIQVAYGYRKRQNRAISTKLTKLKIESSPRSFKEFKLLAEESPVLGSQITIDSVFKVGDVISVTGTTKGHGFAGVIKRHGFHRQPVSGGQSDRVRAPGAIGAQTPGKVIMGKKMPGHYGNVVKTIKSLKIISINPETSEIVISGSLPGSKNSYLILNK